MPCPSGMTPFFIRLRLCDWCQSILTTLQQQTTECLGFHSPTATQLIMSDEMMMNCSEADTDLRLMMFSRRLAWPCLAKPPKSKLYGGIILLSIHRDNRKQPYVMSDPSSFCKWSLSPHPQPLSFSSLPAEQLCTSSQFTLTLFNSFFFQCFKLKKVWGVIHAFVLSSFPLSICHSFTSAECGKRMICGWNTMHAQHSPLQFQSLDPGLNVTCWQSWTATILIF